MSEADSILFAIFGLIVLLPLGYWLLGEGIPKAANKAVPPKDDEYMTKEQREEERTSVIGCLLLIIVPIVIVLTMLG